MVLMPEIRVFSDLLVDKWVAPVWYAVAAGNGNDAIEVDTAGCSKDPLCRHRIRFADGTVSIFAGSSVAVLFAMRGVPLLPHFDPLERRTSTCCGY
jgi:hypothetical protein